MEICYLTANLDSNMAPSEGLTVVYSEYHDCPLKNGDFISYTQPEMDPPTTAGAVSIQDTMYDLYTWEDVEDFYYNEES